MDHRRYFYGRCGIRKRHSETLENRHFGSLGRFARRGTQLAFRDSELVITSYSIHYTKLYDKVGKTSSEKLNIELPRDNAFGNIKRVCKSAFQLSKGNSKLELEVTEGHCYIDLIEIVPESEIKGTPDYFVYTYWHGVLRKPSSNWVSASLSFAVTDDTLYVMQRGRFGNDMKIKDFSSENSDDNHLTLTIFDNMGKATIEKRGAKEIKMVDIRKLPSGSYFALLSDEKNYWITKQFIKY